MAAALQISGTGEYVPSQQVTSDALDVRWNKPSGWTRRHSGIVSRQFAQGHETSSKMAAEAVRQAARSAAVSLDQLDCIVSACSVMEQAIPCNAALIQRELGLGQSGIPAFDVNATCLSFLVALDLISMALQAGRYRMVAIVSSEIASAGLPWDEPATAMLFGDGAGAVILTATHRPRSGELLASHFENYVMGAEHCRINAGGTRLRVTEEIEVYRREAQFHMDGKATYRLAAQKMQPFLDTLLDKAGVKLDQLAAIIPHQASDKALHHLQHMLKLPDEMIVRTLATRGNQMAASIPVTLHVALQSGRVKNGDLIALVGSGAGLSFGGAVIRV